MQCVRLGDRLCQGSRLLQLDGLYVASESCLGVFGCLSRAERLSDPMSYADLGTRSEEIGSADNSKPVLLVSGIVIRDPPQSRQIENTMLWLRYSPQPQEAFFPR